MIDNSFIELSSNQNQNIKRVRKLKRKKYRDEFQEFILEGIQIIEAAINMSGNIKEVYISEEVHKQENIERIIDLFDERADKYLLEAELFAEISETVNSQGILAVAEMKTCSLDNLIDLEGPILLLAGLQDPGNAGTLIRSASAAGFAGIIALKGTVDIYNPKVIRASMGGIFDLELIKNVDIKDLNKKFINSKRRMIFAEPGAAKPYYDFVFKENDILTIGNEARGLSNEIYELEHESISIPIKGNIESLNAAMAGTILIFEMVRSF
ncbi:RNA methyltransferase [Halanaerobiaceae bacterium Z-7014]|uniref:RNA methyltransferase n=1 Tax=Halonatronomonas betaini TaxID=2778430 RepID=A0A931F9I1_9FIRM|nr:RNA methyltransferase [Halonatronomonas betaini]MBF8437608.1 RNA methyltransferase [Halonatronomonas betaini]